MKTPCYNCITKAVCRHKTYHQLTKDCKLIVGYRIIDLRDTLNPTDWRFSPFQDHQTPRGENLVKYEG